mmetsp:Transcript_17645/g.28199  ORF Transcript_17645/g.28199 Transcript_17645/m.28199 type:complete len:228 (+) Transcript_17645:32-715(+)
MAASGEGNANEVDLEVTVEGNKPLPYGWSKETTEDGQALYRNNITKETQLEFPTQRARPKPRGANKNKPGEHSQSATELAKQRRENDRNMLRPTPASQRCIKLCVGTPYKEEYNEEYSDFNNKSSNCCSFMGSVGYHTISICKNGGCMLILLPWAIVIDVVLLLMAVLSYIICCGECCWCLEGGRVGFCCLGTFLLRSCVGFCCWSKGECDIEGCCLRASLDGNYYL